MRLYKQFQNFIVKSSYGHAGKRVFMTAAMLVVFVTTYLLILPAFTQTANTYCGKEEHAHGEECYQISRELSCGKEEKEGHTHTDSCYSTSEELTCGKEEYEGHQHSDSCYETSRELNCDKEENEEHQHSDSCYKTHKNLVCDKEESNGHHHSSDCYTENSKLTCDQEESASHTHSDACYEEKKTLICTQEEHTHGEACYSNPKADVESASIWERTMKGVRLTGKWSEDVLAIAETQLGYQESKSNYIIDANKQKKGYTRYGAWYGDPYGDWCAMFASFCINYAGIPRNYMPVDSSCQQWIETLNKKSYKLYYAWNDRNDYKVLTEGEEYTPAAGDLVFFNWDNEPDADHVGIIYDYKEATEHNPAVIKTVEGNSSNSVTTKSYDLDNSKIMGFGRLPENPNYVDPDQEVAEEATTEEIAKKAAKQDAEEATTEEVAEEATTEELAEEATTEEAAEEATTEELAEEATTEEVAEEATTEELAEEAATEETAEEATTEELAEEATTEEVAEEATTEELAEEATTEELAEEATTEETEDEDRIVKTMEGHDYSITVKYTEEAMLPEDVELDVHELFGLDYQNKLKEAQEAMNLDSITFARFFDITFLSQGEEVEPEAPVEVTINYDTPPAIGEDDIGNAVHFTNDGPEILDIQKEEEENGSTSISFQQDSFSVTGTVYGVSTLADDGSSLLADDNGYSDPPAVGSLVGRVVQTPVVGEWYMMYGYNSNGSSYVLPESWPNRGSGNTWATDPCPTLSTASNTVGGTVAYVGTDDVAWQYVGDGGFVNRHGYYMYLTTNNTSGAGVTEEYSVTRTPSSTQYSVQYSWDKKAFYATNGSGRYSVIMINNQGYSDHGYGYGSYTFGNMTSPYVGLPHYLAQVTNLDPIDGGHDNHPPTSLTGSVSYRKPVLYNIDATQETMTGVSGVVYTITNKSTGATTTVTSGSTIDVALQTLPAGTYTIEQTSVPSGYVVTPQKREFVIDSNGQGQPGIFFLYKDSDYGADKTAQVIDYVNRIYQIELSANSGKYSYDVDPINLVMVVDQSNSMLFPQTLTEVSGATVHLYREGSGNNQTNDQRLNDLVDSGKLKKNTTYYLVTDNTGDTATSTVYAIFWDGSGWCYQDASYYSKAYRHWVLGDEQNVKEKNAYVNFVKSTDTYSDATHGASISSTLSDKFEKDLGKSGNAYKDYQLYTGSEYNRLHELQQSVATLAGLISSFNPQSTMTIETFAKDVYSCKDYTLNNAGLVSIIDAVNHITTLGGTRQDLALQHVYGDYYARTVDTSTAIDMDHSAKKNHLTNKDDYVVLITDGAPNNTSDTNSIQTVINTASTLKGKMSGNDKLITIGLGALNVGGEMLPQSASSPSSTYYKRVEQTGDLSNYFLNLFTKALLINRKSVASEGDIVDVVSDSFYITDKDGNALKAGDRINLSGDPDSSGPGLICYDETKQEWYVRWDNQTLGSGDGSGATYTYTDGNGTSTVVDTSKIYNITWSNGMNVLGSEASRNTSNDQLMFQDGSWIYAWRDTSSRKGATESAMSHITTSGGGSGSSWKGHVYLKAKEDFIGGNTIDTNKSATVTLDNDDSSSSGAGISLPTPTVNVRLLEMEGFESEETVFLGDDVTDIQKKLQTLLEKTVIEKIKKSTGNQMNYKEGATEANGCYEDHFTIPYAIRDLTTEEWSRLLAGQTVDIEYTYDDASSHGAVGYFTFSLKKEAVEKEPSTYEDHESAVSGQDVEKYTLTVTYTAYKIGETDSSNHERTTNVHNGANGPGTEVGTGSDIPHGKGVESVEEIHHVHVIDGEIFLTKVIDETLKSDQDRTYTFNLYIKDPVTGEASSEIYRSVDVTVKANETQGTVHISNLPRNSYYAKEAEGSDYVVNQVAVIAGDTTCKYISQDLDLEFEIGTNQSSSKGTNPNKNVIIYNQTLPTYENSYWVEDERYVYSKPFAKLPNTNDSGDTSSTDTQSGTSDTSTETQSGTSDSSSGDTQSGTSDTSTGTQSTHKETITVEDYAWDSGTLISKDTSGSQYKKLENTTADMLDSSHTSYGVLTQSSSNKDDWTITWNNWSSHGEESTTYDWPVGTIISKDTSGSSYTRLNDTADVLDGNHTSYGILKRNSSGDWVVEWHTWTSSGGGSSTDGNVTITFYNWRYGEATGKTITVPKNQAVTITYTIDDSSQSAGYWTGGAGQGWTAKELSKTAVSGSANTYQATFTPTDDTIFCYSYTNSNAVSTFVSYSTAGQTTTWDVDVKTLAAETSMLPTSTSTETIWSKATETVKADATKIPKTTREEEIDVPDDPDDPNVDLVTITKLSAGHGAIYNTVSNFDAEIPVQKTWDDGGAHTSDEVYVVLYKDGSPVTDSDGNAKMLRLNSSNSFKGYFTVSVSSKDHNPLEDGYEIREVKRKETSAFDGGSKAILVNDTLDSNVYYVQLAIENEMVTINGTAYNAHYKNVANRMLVVQNNKAYELPKTGGLGTNLYTRGGITLIITALVLYIFSLRRRRRKEVYIE